MSPTKRIPLPLLAFAFVALVRGLIAYSRLDEHELEMFSGSLAQALRSGLPLDSTQLAIIPHARGSAVFGVLLVPIFALLGPTLFAIKCLAVLLSSTTAALFAHVLKRHAGSAAAIVGTILLAFAPPTFQMVDTLALGSHADVLLCLLITLALLPGPAVPNRSGAGGVECGFGRLVAAGTSVGFGVFFSLQYLVALPALALAWLVTLPRRLWLRAALVVAGAALPWALLVRWMTPRGVETVVDNQPLEERILPDGVAGAAAKLWRTLSDELPRSWGYADQGLSWAAWALLLAMGLGVLGWVPRLKRREPIAIFFALHPWIVVGAYAATNFRMDLHENLNGMGSRYMMPMLPSLFAGIALGAQACLDRGLRIPLALFFTPTLVGSALGALALVAPQRGHDLPPQKGTEFAYFHQHIELATPGDLDARLAWIDKLDPDWGAWRALTYSSFAPTVDAAALADSGGVKSLRELIENSSPSVQPFQWGALGLRFSPDQLDAVAWSAIEDQELGAPWLARGIGCNAMTRWIAAFAAALHTQQAPLHLAPALKRTDALPPGVRRNVLEGMGFFFGRRATPYQRLILRILDQLDTVPPDVRAPFLSGFGSGFRMRFQEDGFRPPGALQIESHFQDEERWFRDALDAGRSE